MAEGGGHPCPGAPDTSVLGTITEPSLEPSLPPPSQQPAASHCERGGGGDLRYPKSLTPAQQHALRDRLSVLTHGHAQQILDELSGRSAISQVKNPVRYCSILIQRMQRGEFSPELGLNVAEARQAEVKRQAALTQAVQISAIESLSQPSELTGELRDAVNRARALAVLRHH
jgi:hypothetical protein